jgi:hypothetical protein
MKAAFHWKHKYPPIAAAVAALPASRAYLEGRAMRLCAECAPMALPRSASSPGGVRSGNAAGPARSARQWSLGTEFSLSVFRGEL